MRWLRAVLATVVGLAACGEEKPVAGEARVATRAELPAIMAQIFDAATYDTVTWTTERAAIIRGNGIYVEACAFCHGLAGEGGHHYVLHGDTIETPSFLEHDWPLANDPRGLRRRVFLGNVRGMPHWGLRLAPRELVAIDIYIRKHLRRGISPAGQP